MPSPALEALFHPRGIAIAGGSSDPEKPGHHVLRNLLEAGFPNHLAAIHPIQSSVLGVPAHPDLRSVPGPVEMLILALPARTTPEMVSAIKQRNHHRSDLRVVVTIGGGYAETGSPEGCMWQAQLTEGCRAAGVRLVGPNCLGVLDNRSRVDTTFLTGVHRKPGGISLLSQSGAMGAWMSLEWAAMPLPVGLNKFISLGNMADLDMAEVMDYLAHDPTTRAIGLYLEGHPRARRLLEAAGRAARRKPVVVLKGGRTEAGSGAARSHTGILAGSDQIYDGAFRQYGLIRTNRADDFTVTLHAFDRLPLHPGGRIAVLTNAGGPGVYAMDAITSKGLSLGRFSPATHTALKAALPAFAAVGQPDGYADMTGGVNPAQVAQAVAAVLRDPGFDAVFQVFVPTRFSSVGQLAQELLNLLPGVKRNSIDKPLYAVMPDGPGTATARRQLEENAVATFGSTDQAAAALAAMVTYGAHRRQADMAADSDRRPD